MSTEVIKLRMVGTDLAVLDGAESLMAQPWNKKNIFNRIFKNQFFVENYSLDSYTLKLIFLYLYLKCNHKYKQKETEFSVFSTYFL